MQHLPGRCENPWADAGKASGLLVLMVNGLPPLAATLRWYREGRAGIAFDIPVPFDVLAQWVPMAQRQMHERSGAVASARLATSTLEDSASIA